MPATQSVPFCEERKLCPKTLMFIHEEPAWPLPPYCLWVSITAAFIWGHLSGPMNGWGDERDGGAGEGSRGAVPSPFPAGQAHQDPSMLLRGGEPCPTSPRCARAPLCCPSAGEVESPPLGVQEEWVLTGSWGLRGSLPGSCQGKRAGELHRHPDAPLPPGLGARGSCAGAGGLAFPV